ncbi:E3 ubiquitin-protein ligase ZNRF1 [Megalops cyprinoides]|uniref:E3 ubiquitin-protein ligase ZNRF1 n=1 Tax=Megalops cyprinoides TaxID=118141 RepID=UPI001864195E|nr:E3 ubiquitin-protein ligase ZNRF1 [Megalops cyprinoides]
MGTRSSRLQEEAVASALEKDGIKRDSCRRLRAKRPTSLVVDFSGSFDQDSEINRSRSEEGSDSDQGQPVRADGSPGDLSSPSRPDQTAPLGESSDSGKPAEDSGSGNGRDGSSDRLAAEETSRVPHRTFSERLPSGRHTSGSRSGSARAARARSAVARPVSEAWIGVSYRVSSRHATVRCPFCFRPFPGGRIEEHLLSCLTSPPLPYNVDTLTKDSGECSICLEDLLQGETIARLACLCIYHKSCIESWCKVKACCPEHPFE